MSLQKVDMFWELDLHAQQEKENLDGSKSLASIIAEKEENVLRRKIDHREEGEKTVSLTLNVSEDYDRTLK